MSRSPQSTASTSTYCGLSDSIIHEYDSSQISEKLQQITNEKNILQKKYDDLCVQMMKISQSQHESDSFKTIIQEKEQDIEDLQYRLQINIQTKHKLEKENQALKQRNEEMCSKLISFENNLNSKAQLTVAENTKLREKVLELQEKLNKQTIYSKTLESDQDKLIRACQMRYDSGCSSLTEVYHILESSAQTTQSQSSHSESQEEKIDHRQVEKLISKYKKLKRKSLELTKNNELLKENAKNYEFTISSLQEDIVKLERENKELIKKDNKISYNICDLNNQITNLNNLNQALESQINQLKSIRPQKIYDLQPQILMQHKQMLQEPNNDDLILKEQEKLMKRINELDNVNTNLQKEKEQYEKQIRQLQEKCKDTSNQLEEISTQLEVSRKINEELQRTNKMLQNSLTERTEPKQLQRSPQNEINEKNYNMLRQKCKEQSQEIAHLQSEIDIFENQQSLHNKRIRELENEIKEKDELITDLNKDIVDLNEKVERKESSKDDFINEKLFDNCVFEPQLAKEVSVIVTHPSLQKETKLKTIFQKIAQRSEENHQKLVAKLNNVNDQMNQLENTVNLFLLDITLAVDTEALTIKDINSEKGKNFNNLLRNMRAALRNFSIENERLQHQLHVFTDLGYQDGQNVQEWHQKNQEAMEQYKAEAIKAKKNLNKCVKQCQILAQQMEKNNKDHQNEKEKLINTIKELEYKSESQNNELHVAKNSIQRLQAEIKMTKKYYEDAHKQLEENHKQTLEQIERDVANNIGRNAHEEEIYQNQLNDYIVKNKEQNALINSLRTQLQASNVSLKQLAEEKENLQKNIEEIQNNYAEQNAKEKENSKAATQRIIQELTRNLENNRNDLESLIVAQNTLQHENNELREELSSMSFENSKLESLITDMREQIERQEKLSQASIKAATLYAETQAKEQIDKERIMHDKENKKVIANVFTAFSKFVDTSSKIDERSMKNLLQKVVDSLDELERTNNNVRQMLKVSERQTTEDAVAQLLLSISHE